METKVSCCQLLEEIRLFSKPKGSHAKRPKKEGEARMYGEYVSQGQTNVHLINRKGVVPLTPPHDEKSA